MTSISDVLLKKEQLTSADICFLLGSREPRNVNALLKRAYEVKQRYVGTQVFLRGLLEISNICQRDCLYCGIRKSNHDVVRFRMTKTEIIRAAVWIHQRGYGSLVLQGGERRGPGFVDFIEDVVREIKHLSGGKLGITLSLGEQDKEVYARWFEAGAHRYLLRIETSNAELFSRIHPPGYSLESRIISLEHLRETGYQVGTGVMIGLPGQTIEDLASDILFFREKEIDMIGMGPYIPHHASPMFSDHLVHNADSRFTLGLKMLAVARIVLKDVNLAATTALQALKSEGRELGLKAGANIIMPNVTDTKYRSGYQLYDNKPGIDENSESCRSDLLAGVKKFGETIAFNEWGDSKHFYKRRERCKKLREV